MITILALDPCDGWIFAKDGERILLLRPPYRLSEAQVLSEAVAARGVTHHGYAACDLQLASWADVIAHVRAEVARQRESDGRTIPDEDVGRSFLRFAPMSAVERFLERIQEELIPREELDQAAKILQAIQIESPRLRESSELGRRTAVLLEDVQRKIELRTRLHVREDDRFPRLLKRQRLPVVRDYGQRVSHAGSMFVPQGSRL